MKRFHSLEFLKPSLAVATVIASLGAYGTRTAHAQTLLRPAIGTTIYESSEHNGPYAGANAFDGTPTAGSIANLGQGFAVNGDNGDHNPILAFDLGSTRAVGGLGYSQFNGNGADTLDLVGTINVFSLTQAQYNTYTAGLVTSGTQPGAGGKVNVAAPTSFTGELSISPSQAANDNYNFYPFANSATLNGEYYAVQFLGVAGPNGGPQNPGATEFELTAAVPEPGTVRAIGFTICVAALFARRRLAV